MATRAWMLRNDGKEFPVTIHIYGDKDFVEETVYAAEWLYKHTNSEKTKHLILEFLATWINDEIPYSEGVFEDTIRYLRKNFGSTKVISKEFLQSISSTVDDLIESGALEEDLEDLNIQVMTDLNNEFCRVRNGGMINSSTSDMGEIYFRISSTNGFNWFDVIWNFVYKHKNQISSVTICKDYEATGSEKIYTHVNKVFDRMQVDEFIMMKGNPIVEKLSIS